MFHHLKFHYEGILSDLVVLDSIPTSTILNWAYQHLTLLKLMQVIPAEKMGLCIRFEIPGAE
jgi:hypothetical protein